MKKVVIFGATGGLGNLISKRLVDYDIINLGSSDVDITDHMQVNEFFKNNLVDIVINFAGVNFDKFAHKLNAKNEILFQKKRIYNEKMERNKKYFLFTIKSLPYTVLIKLGFTSLIKKRLKIKY